MTDLVISFSFRYFPCLVANIYILKTADDVCTYEKKIPLLNKYISKSIFETRTRANTHTHARRKKMN